MPTSAKSKQLKKLRASIRKTIQRGLIGKKHYLVTIPIVVGQLRRIEVFTSNGIILDTSSKYLYRVCGMPFGDWLEFAVNMYENELRIVELALGTKTKKKLGLINNNDTRSNKRRIIRLVQNLNTS
jgi:hypothetical protein